MTHHSAFEEVEQRYIRTLDFTVHKYVHRNTGAEHFHFDSDHDENVFLIALRTMPEDSSGVAHILEHTALCGSARFPVRDPFFLMIRRSLNTFMNAFTGSDYTAYPFASQNRKDYFNLLDIYLDAVFFARLDPLDFAQEGHRLEFAKPSDPSSDLVYKGIVYNEMKGDTSSPVSRLYSTMQHHLFPTSTYHYNSGGDPKEIPGLKYDDLHSFYRSHYHPSNAVFMTFGNIPVIELQSFFEEKALSQFDKRDDSIGVDLERRYDEPKRFVESYPETESKQRTHVIISWLLGENTDLEMLLKCHLLSDVLLDTSASPLRKALEGSELGSAISPLSGLEETNREMSFTCGLERSEQAHTEAIEALIENTLKNILRDGISVDRLESVLHQLELSQREIGGDGSPYGLQVMFSCLSAAIHRGDPLSLLDLEAALVKLRQSIQDPQFITQLIADLLVNNPHRVTLTLVPDTQMAEREDTEEKETLELIKRSLPEEQISALIKQADALAIRQLAEEDLSVLPKVGLEDVGTPHVDPESTRHKSPTPITYFKVGTNGVTYQQVIARLPRLPEYELLPLYTGLLTEIGSASRSYIDTQLQQHAKTGGINAFTSIRTEAADLSEYQAYYTVSSKTLANKTGDMFALVKDTTEQPNFTEHGRIRELVKQFRVRRDASITGSGHLLAMAAASSGLRPVTHFNYQLYGIGGLQRLRSLDDSLDDSVNLAKFVDDLSTMHEQLRAGQRQLLLITDPSSTSAVVALESLWSESTNDANESLSIEMASVDQDLAFTANTQVNFCAAVYPTVPENDPDSPALSVLASVLRNGYLHPVIREQGGAYGGGAMHDSANGIFRFYSYRDPNLQTTFDVFDRAMEWLNSNALDAALVEEAILGLVSSLDAPGSPAGEARLSFHNQLFGRNSDVRKSFREAILNTTVDNVSRAAANYLAGDRRRATITSKERISELEGDFEHIAL
jgi:Zn-dependent M16 (insulinase) family peptidase